MNTNSKNWIWWLLTLSILFSMTIGLWVATKNIDYTWRWNRIPQYFFFNDETTKSVSFDGTVTKIDKNGGSTTVTVKSENDQSRSF